MSDKKWQEFNRKILDALDIRGEYESMGVITSGEPNHRGWLSCNIITNNGESNPSAGINCGPDYPQRGRYKEFTGQGRNLSFFEFCASAANRYTDWEAARDSYAQLVGIDQPTSKKPALPDSKLTFVAWNDAVVSTWCKLHKKGIFPSVIRVAGAKLAQWPTKKRYNVIALPIYGEHLLDDNPTGWMIYNLSGKELAVSQGKNKPPRMVKSLCCGGSDSGIMNAYGIGILSTAEYVWMPEGPSDNSALQSIVPKADIKRHSIICNSNGAVENLKTGILAALAGKKVIVFGDCDEAGVSGGMRRAQQIAATANETRFMIPPFRIVEKHGSDLRDWITGSKRVCRYCEGTGNISKTRMSLADLKAIEFAKGDCDKCDGFGIANLNATDENTLPIPTFDSIVKLALCEQLVGPAIDFQSSKSESIDFLSLLNDHSHNDLINGKRIAKLFVGRILYCPELGVWLVWDGCRWQIDRSLIEIEKCAKVMALNLFDEIGKISAARILSTEKRNAMMEFVKSVNNESKIRSAIKMARSEDSLITKASSLDTKPFLLNTLSGTLDLETGMIRPHDPADKITQLCPLVFDPDAQCPVWLKTLDTTFSSNANLISFLQRLYGYCLTGSVKEQIFVIFAGTGSNGKSLVIGIQRKVMGPDDAMKSPADFLTVKKNESHPTELADLFRKRFVACVETEDGSRLNESRVKETTGGDPIRARWMHGNFWEFEPTHKIILATNHKPSFHANDYGMTRRLRVVSFDRTIPDSEQDKDLMKKLEDELPGILAWCVRGCTEWIKNGLGTPHEVVAATDEYKSDNDILGRWIEQRCFEGRNYKERSSNLYEDFRDWSGGHCMSQKKFSLALEKRKEISIVRSNGSWVIGLALADQAILGFPE